MIQNWLAKIPMSKFWQILEFNLIFFQPLFLFLIIQLDGYHCFTHITFVIWRFSRVFEGILKHTTVDLFYPRIYYKNFT